MDLYLLDETFTPIEVFSTYTSLIWTERYSESGDFELVLPFRGEHMHLFTGDKYLVKPGNPEPMIVQGLEVNSREGELETRVTGRSLMEVLSLRVCVLEFSGYATRNLHTHLKQLFEANFSNPTDVNRKIPEIVWVDASSKASKNDMRKFVELGDDFREDEFTWKNYFEVVSDYAALHDFGFRVTLNDNKKIRVQLYFGDDRSLDQNERDAVVFSTSMGNLDESNYLSNHLTYKNHAYILGETWESGLQRWNSAKITENWPSGLNRKEVVVDGTDILSRISETNVIPAPEYMKLLNARGKTELAKMKPDTIFDGRVTNTDPYDYRRDYFLGDIVHLISDFGISGKARVTEFITSVSSSDYSEYPTLTMLDQE